jgi:hypothetical protein
MRVGKNKPDGGRTSCSWRCRGVTTLSDPGFRHAGKRWRKPRAGVGSQRLGIDAANQLPGEVGLALAAMRVHGGNGASELMCRVTTLHGHELVAPSEPAGRLSESYRGLHAPTGEKPLG